MKYWLLILIAGVLSVSSLNAGATQIKTPSSYAPSTFIVLCDCNTHLKRTLIEHEINKAGGKVLFMYEDLGGFAVKTSKSDDPDQLERRLRGIRGVKSIERDGEAGVNTGS